MHNTGCRRCCRYFVRLVSELKLASELYSFVSAILSFVCLVLLLGELVNGIIRWVSTGFNEFLVDNLLSLYYFANLHVEVYFIINHIENMNQTIQRFELTVNLWIMSNQKFWIVLFFSSIIFCFWNIFFYFRVNTKECWIGKKTKMFRIRPKNRSMIKIWGRKRNLEHKED